MATYKGLLAALFDRLKYHRQWTVAEHTVTHQSGLTLWTSGPVHIWHPTNVYFNFFDRLALKRAVVSMKEAKATAMLTDPELPPKQGENNADAKS